MKHKYDIIVIGGGHAGCEAALASSRMGLSTLLITMDKKKIGYTSCNPSIGGIGKGQLVKEVDALGGEMGKAADASCIQFRMLNSSKGYAARSSRMQIDREKYNEYMFNCVTKQNNLEVLEAEVKELFVEKGICKGIITAERETFESFSVVLTPGTFMEGTIHIGMKHFPGGRIKEPPSIGLSENLLSLGFKIGYLKTGTPARLDGKTIDFSVLAEQEGDDHIIPFSFSTEKIDSPQRPCYMTRTNQKTHDIILKNLDRSPLYSGKIKSTGVRYCPSIEDKIIRFSERDSHVIFLEPEGLSSNEYYPNGISTSLPVDVQKDILHSIKGLEKVEFNTPAYGIEYVYVEPTQLLSTLETKRIAGLFMAGQINGTTGYEEAAALGLIAGINAALKVRKEEPLVLQRAQAYIGVLIDDLVTKGTKEPYRMFTSRVEYRIVIREDNADIRLSEIGNKIGLVSNEAVDRVNKRKETVKKQKEKLSAIVVRHDDEKVLALLKNKAEAPFLGKVSLLQLLKRPGIKYEDLELFMDEKDNISYYEKVQIEVDVKYGAYIDRDLQKIKRFKDLEKIIIPENFDYSEINGLSNEIKEKLTDLKPYSLGQASRISGVTPAAITILMVRLRNRGSGTGVRGT